MANKRLTKDDWIDAAMTVLRTGGIDLVRVDNLAKKLSITRGSFYYHFDNRQDLLKSLLEKWRLQATEAVISGLNKKYTDPRERLIQLMSLPLRGKRAFNAASIETSLRAWARRDKMARAAVEEIDNYRISFIQSLFAEMGHDKERSGDLAHLVYSYLISTSQMHPNNDDPALRERMLRIADFLCQP